jgi:hypothetical protein
VHVLEVWVAEGLLGRDPLRGLELDQLKEEVNCRFIHVNAHLFQAFIGVVDFPLGEAGFKVWEVTYALPGLITRRAHDFKDLEDLTDLRVPVEEGALVCHFEEYAAH